MLGFSYSHSAQIPGTATFLNKWGDITVFGNALAILALNSSLMNARLKCAAGSQTT
jgi:hypothetical protein